MKRIIAWASQSLRHRLLASVLLGILFGWVFSEVAFLFLRDESDHAPGRIEVVIPAGTAERVAAGQPIPSIPANLSFVVGDTLVVKNQDNVSHQLGPLWVPPGASASLLMERENRYAYECTFQSTKYLGLDVRPRVTHTTRLQAILMAGPPMGMLIFVYSLVMFPLKPKTHDQSIT